MLLREFLMQAKTLGDRDRILNFFLSEKLDGSRAFWDGGVSRGVATKDVPWANIFNPKKPRQLKSRLKPVATGLWSRYGNPVIAPDWFLNTLPRCPLDGELYAGPGNFQKCRSIVAGNTPGEGWHQISYAVFGSPPLQAVFGTGELRNPQYRGIIDSEECKTFFKARKGEDYQAVGKFATFTQELNFLQHAVDLEGPCYMVPQTLLPKDNAEARWIMTEKLAKILRQGGEGVVMRDAASMWRPKRVASVLKVKPVLDATGIVTGFTAGQKTDRGSKFLGKIGAVILDFGGLRLELSGMKHALREFTPEWAKYAAIIPGRDMPLSAVAENFKIGDRVDFKYRELSDGGIPKDARYLRTREGYDD